MAKKSTVHRRADGSRVVIANGRIVTNLPRDGVLEPVSGESLGSALSPGAGSNPITGTDIDATHDAFTVLMLTEKAENAHADFDNYLRLSAFTSEGEDTTRGKHWDGAVLHASTEEGQAKLERIIANPEATQELKDAAERLMIEVRAYESELQVRVDNEIADESLQTEAYIDDSVLIRTEHGNLCELSPQTSVLGESEIYNVATEGAVIIADSQVHSTPVSNSEISSGSRVHCSSVSNSEVSGGSSLRNTEVTDSFVDASRVQGEGLWRFEGADGMQTVVIEVARSHVTEASEIIGAQVTDSRIAGATVTTSWDTRNDQERGYFKTIVHGSSLEHGAVVSGAFVTESTIQGTVIGTGIGEAKLVGVGDGRMVLEENPYASRDGGWGVLSNEKRRALSRMAYSTVERSTVGRGSEVRNTNVVDTVLGNGADVSYASVSRCTIEGTAHVAGHYRHILTPENSENPRGWLKLVEDDGRARVENVHLTREYVGPYAHVTEQSDVESVVTQGRLITRYRTGKRGGVLRKRLWGYTISEINPNDGSTMRTFIGVHGAGKTAQEQLDELAKLF